MLATQDYTLFDLTEALPVHVLTKKEIIKRNVDLLLRRLLQVEAGDTITYSELAEACPGAHNHEYLRRVARELAQEEHSVVFQPLNGVALRRVPMDSVATVATDGARKRIKSAVTTWGRKLDAVDVHQLTTDESRAEFVRSSTRHYYQRQIEEMGDRQASLAVEAARAEQSIDSASQMKKIQLAARAHFERMG
jgi:hypothetical protein